MKGHSEIGHEGKGAQGEMQHLQWSSVDQGRAPSPESRCNWPRSRPSSREAPCSLGVQDVHWGLVLQALPACSYPDGRLLEGSWHKLCCLQFRYRSCSHQFTEQWEPSRNPGPQTWAKRAVSALRWAVFPIEPCSHHCGPNHICLCVVATAGHVGQPRVQRVQVST